MHLPVWPVIQHTRRKACALIHKNFADAAPREQFNTSIFQNRPIGEIGATLGPRRTTQIAGARIDAFLTSIVILTEDRHIRRPPVIAFFIEPFSERLAQFSNWDRRQFRTVVGIGRVAPQTRHTCIAVVHIVKWRKRFIINRPIRPNTIQAMGAEI